MNSETINKSNRFDTWPEEFSDLRSNKSLYNKAIKISMKKTKPKIEINQQKILSLKYEK